jgi:RNA ligase (TIGR02306 family)
MELRVEVVKLGPVLPHPDADALDIVKVFDYPLVAKRGTYRDGDLAIYFPIDSVVPDLECLRFLNGGQPLDRRHARIQPKKLRGVFSMGLLMPIDDIFPKNVNVGANGETLKKSDIIDGMDVTAFIGVVKYEPPPVKVSGGKGGTTVSDQEPGPAEHVAPTYSDIETILRWPAILQEGEEVVVTEKIHGANMRAVWLKDEELPAAPKCPRCEHKATTLTPEEVAAGIYVNECTLCPTIRERHEKRLRDGGRLWVGSHRQWKAFAENSWWWKAARAENLEEKLKAYPGYVFYGEAYGDVQDMRYGCGFGEVRARFFDVYKYTKEWAGYLDFVGFASILQELDLPMTPVLYKGKWERGLTTRFVDGTTILMGSITNNGEWRPDQDAHIREGIVVKPVVERHDSGDDGGFRDALWNKRTDILLKLVEESKASGEYPAITKEQVTLARDTKRRLFLDKSCAVSVEAATALDLYNKGLDVERKLMDSIDMSKLVEEVKATGARSRNGPGRVVFKHVSQAYLLRKGGTEAKEQATA